MQAYIVTKLAVLEYSLIGTFINFRGILEGRLIGLILRPFVVKPLQYLLAGNVCQINEVFNHCVLHQKLQTVNSLRCESSPVHCNDLELIKTRCEYEMAKLNPSRCNIYEIRIQMSSYFVDWAQRKVTAIVPSRCFPITSFYHIGGMQGRMEGKCSALLVSMQYTLDELKNGKMERNNGRDETHSREQNFSIQTILENGKKIREVRSIYRWSSRIPVHTLKCCYVLLFQSFATMPAPRTLRTSGRV